LNGLGPPWHNFVQVNCGRENLPNFESLWDAFIGEEMRLLQVSTSHEDVPDLALVGKVRKGGKKLFEKGQKKKEDLGSFNRKRRIRAISSASTTTSMAIMLLSVLRRRGRVSSSSRRNSLHEVDEKWCHAFPPT
jgi:hypothetical protein